MVSTRVGCTRTLVWDTAWPSGTTGCGPAIVMMFSCGDRPKSFPNPLSTLTTPSARVGFAKRYTMKTAAMDPTITPAMVRMFAMSSGGVGGFGDGNRGGDGGERGGMGEEEVPTMAKGGGGGSGRGELTLTAGGGGGRGGVTAAKSVKVTPIPGIASVSSRSNCVLCNNAFVFLILDDVTRTVAASSVKIAERTLTPFSFSMLFKRVTRSCGGSGVSG